MIAQIAQPTGAQLLVWLGCLAAVLGSISFLLMLYNQSVTARRNFRGEKERAEITPQPLVVKGATEFVTKHDFERDREDLVNKIDEVKGQVAEQTRVSAIQRKSLYDKIDAVRKEVSDKIENMPAQVVTQLLNTKNLWRSDI